ncbi:TPA: metallophosphoesterase [Raoultella ornithinolytica]
MTISYGLISDQHYANWNSFSTTDIHRLNSRLKIQLDATIEAAKAIKAAGAEWMFCAGDTFHVRGSINPTVLHFVTETYKTIINDIGLKVAMLAGNHDLETNDSVYSANAASSLEAIGVQIVCGRPWSVQIGDLWVHMVSWRNSHAALLSDLKTLRKTLAGDNHHVIIHVGINDAIPTMPNVGVEAQDLKDLGFRMVFSGHYHNHKEIIPGVVSVGALTHQNWGDVGTLAGYLLVDEDATFEHHETSAPKFINLEEGIDEAEIKGNYIRYRATIESDEDGIRLKNVLNSLGAKGVVTNFIKKSSLVVAGASTAETSKIDSLKESVSAYCKIMSDTDAGIDLIKLDSLCNEILTEAEMGAID